MVWYAHLFQNFPQFIVIHTVKGFDIVNKAYMCVCVCVCVCVCFRKVFLKVSKKKKIPLSLLVAPHFSHLSSYSQWVLSTTKVVVVESMLENN